MRNLVCEQAHDFIVLEHGVNIVRNDKGGKLIEVFEKEPLLVGWGFVHVLRCCAILCKEPIDRFSCGGEVWRFDGSGCSFTEPTLLRTQPDD